MKASHRALPLHHHQRAGGRVGQWGRLCWASLGPFLAAALLGSLLFRTTTRGGGAGEVVVQRNPRSVLEEPRLPGGCLGADCKRFDGFGAAAAGDGGGSSGAAGSAPTLAAAASSLGGGAGSGGGGSIGPSAESSLPAGDLPQLFLFIGILSGRGYRHRRLAVREAWSNRAQIPGQVVARFILSEDERTPQVEKELEAYGDIVFVREKTNYKSILYKTYYVMEYAATHYNASFVLKTDDDAFINLLPLLDQLAALCENPGCAAERLYMGKMAKHSEVLLQPGHKWNNAAFHNHTGLKEYPNYMMGGGYVVGGEVARLLVLIHSRMRLKFTPIEDATLGFWLMAMDLRHLDHPRFHTWAAPCCFKAPTRRPGERFVTRFQLAPEFEDLCSPDPWLVLHKIDSPTKMRYVGARVANCTAPTRPWALAPSILPHLPEHRRTELVQRWQAEHPGEELVLEAPQAIAADAAAAVADTSIAANGKDAVAAAAAAGGSAASVDAGAAANGGGAANSAAGNATTAGAAVDGGSVAALGGTSSTATMRGGSLAAAATVGGSSQAGTSSQAGGSDTASGAAAGLGAAGSSSDAGLPGGAAAGEAAAAVSSNPSAATQSAGAQEAAAGSQGQAAEASNGEAALAAGAADAGSTVGVSQAADAGSGAAASQAADADSASAAGQAAVGSAALATQAAGSAGAGGAIGADAAAQAA